jgi:vacuolar-type H+-ATPase subunit C/Vma6
MPGEIDYLNARIRGNAGDLLPEESVLALLGSTTMESWSAALRDTPYSAYLGPVMGDQDSRFFFRAVDLSIAQRTGRLGRLVGGRPGLALSICLSDWDLSNLLSIFSGIHNSCKPVQIVQATLAGGLLKMDQLETLSHSRTLKQAGDLLRLWHFPRHALIRDVLSKNRNSSLPQIRMEFSRRWYKTLLEDTKRTRYRALTNLISDRIDQVNIMTALMWRVLPTDRDPVEFYLHGGQGVDLRTFGNVLEAPDIQGAVSALKPGRVRNLLMAEAAVLNGEEQVSALDQALENDIFHRFSRPLARDPLGVEFMISFLLRLRREGIRLKLSLTRLIYDIPGELLMEMTGYV